MAILRGIRAALDALYQVTGVFAALSLVAILLLIVVQMLARWTGEVFPGAPNYAGYAMASASFLGFANALNRGAHIRVSILLNAVSDRVRKWLEIWCFGVASLVMWYFVYYAYKFVYWSWKFNDISQGQDRTALWMPQSVMLFGATVLAISLTDHLIHVFATGDHRIVRDLTDQSHAE